eukprot:gnl/TRDRNA2_/TRDRNA2_43115_c0_seq1.p1 gnl/TRDRNA2_/TRDRNA2_43115_c0~~gnl/TRDRNA2_/TRDRNA2_43115_c0_seq1.p1  ORF type:complete len:392 (+),score=78.88 gnl/TRDRNA2_/TRDRNA2_43115_c0_seq1:100-1275(+)
MGDPTLEKGSGEEEGRSGGTETAHTVADTAAAAPATSAGIGSREGPGTGPDAEMREEEVLACAFDQWYESFKHLTFKSKVLPLSEDVVKYLLTDGIRLPPAPPTTDSGNDGDDDSEWGDGGDDSDDEPMPSCISEFAQEVDATIKALGGSVLPKLNWSAPKDARWLLCSGLRCENARDVLTVLKASDFVSHDLNNSFDHCCLGENGRRRPDRFCMVLRKWQNDLDDAGEFRCIVHDKRLVAVSQRHTSAHYPHLAEASHRQELAAAISAFFEAEIHYGFSLDRYVFDVHVGKPPQRKVTLVDFSPWGPSTDPLLFDWDELLELGREATTTSSLPEFRVVRTEGEVRSKLENYHAVPFEVAELGARSGEELEEMFRNVEGHLHAETRRQQQQ